MLEEADDDGFNVVEEGDDEGCGVAENKALKQYKHKKFYSQQVVSISEQDEVTLVLCLKQ